MTKVLLCLWLINIVAYTQNPIASKSHTCCVSMKHVTYQTGESYFTNMD